MISQQKFDQIEMDYDCGYWFECCERCCPCAISTEDKGLTQKVWDGFKKEQKEILEQYDPHEFDYMDNDDCNDNDNELLEEDKEIDCLDCDYIMVSDTEEPCCNCREYSKFESD